MNSRPVDQATEDRPLGSQLPIGGSDSGGVDGDQDAALQIDAELDWTAIGLRLANAISAAVYQPSGELRDRTRD